jgi:FkbM family methyltransferase
MVWLGQEENEDLAVARRLLRPGQTFVDCGANIGLWSLTGAAAVGPTGTVIAFEPNPSTADKLAQNVSENRLTWVIVNRNAVGAHAGQVLLRCDSSHNVSQIAAESSLETVSVKVVTLDDAIGDRAVHGIKIDVEGYEIEVLRGRTGYSGCPESGSVSSSTPSLPGSQFSGTGMCIGI